MGKPTSQQRPAAFAGPHSAAGWRFGQDDRTTSQWVRRRTGSPDRVRIARPFFLNRLHYDDTFLDSQALRPNNPSEVVSSFLPFTETPRLPTVPGAAGRPHRADH